MADEAKAFDVSGPVDAPSIVFLHATRQTRAMWASQVAGLSDAFRVITLDLPGHGTRAAERFTLDGAADEVSETIETAAGGRAVLVGLSLGGYVAIRLAGKRPDQVRGLVVAGATLTPRGAVAVPFLGLAWALDTMNGRGLDTLQRAFYGRRFPPDIRDPILARRFWPAGGAIALRSLVGHDPRASLAAYPGPILIINGSRDLPFRVGQRSFVEAGRWCRTVRIAGARHLSNLDQPAAFNLAVRRFVDGLE